MNEHLKQETINKILKREKLFQIREHRLKRLLQDPLQTLVFFLLSLISKIHPIPVTKKTPWGGIMKYDLPEGNQIFYYGFCESNLTIFFIRFLKPGETFIDIGANIGFYSMLASDLVGSTGKILSFEPTPRTFKTLQKNALLQKNISVENMALSDKDETISIADYGSKFSGSNSLNPILPKEVDNFLKTTPTKIAIRATTLDAMVEQYTLHPSFIKIDVEGYESHVLKGMKNVLSLSRPVLSIEMCKHPEWKENVTETFSLLQKNNYRSYEISPLGFLISCERNSYNDINLIFVPEEKVQDLEYLMTK